MFHLFQNQLHQITVPRKKSWIQDHSEYSVSLQALREEHAQINTFTETEQTFFRTIIILFDGEETIFLYIAWFRRSVNGVMLATYSQPVVTVWSKIKLGITNRAAAWPADFIWYEYNGTAHAICQ